MRQELEPEPEQVSLREISLFSLRINLISLARLTSRVSLLSSQSVLSLSLIGVGRVGIWTIRVGEEEELEKKKM